jgi:hypothetical protein
MGSGGLMQLVAYGAQDTYLTGNPQITFFKVVYRRHTNFALESIEQTFNGSANFGKKVTCTISRNGDLIHRVYLQATLPAVQLQSSDGSGAMFRWLDQVGHNLIRHVEVEIGGQKIDKHYGDWLAIWNELTQEAGKVDGYARMIGDVPSMCATKTWFTGGTGIACPTNCAGAAPVNLGSASSSCAPEYTVYVPLQFWFCRNPGLALPLIALQYHEVKINLEFNDLRNMMWESVNLTGGAIQNRIAATGIASASLYVDYVFLDTDERRRFAQVSHEYLIEQLQFTGGESVTSAANKIKLNFNHPCKELVWVVQRDSFVSCAAADVSGFYGMQPFNYSDWQADYSAGYPGVELGSNPVVAAKIQLNGHDRFSERDGSYFELVQPYQHHTNVPTTHGINVYSFALKPEEHQPSGSCNFSRIDNATLILTLSQRTIGSGNTAQVRVYAINYNVLRVMSGMGGLAYSN